jgi:hypothetical protein
MKLLKPMNPNEREDHILNTFFTLSIGMGILAIVFPLILGIGGYTYAGLPLQNSMSAYYHANIDHRSMRDWFVGILFAIGAFLYLYKGFSPKEDIALNLAGIFAWGIALFPMEWECTTNCSKFSIHGTCASLFFLCISFVCIFCSSDTTKLILNEQSKRNYKIVYRILGGLMLASPLIAFTINLLLQQPGSIIFYIEAAGIFAFALYWLTKSRELSRTDAIKRIFKGYGLTAGH